jgi:hypothetical protein
MSTQSERTQAALILAESATGLLERHVGQHDQDPIEKAAAALLEAGLTLLLDKSRKDCPRLYLLTEQRHQELHHTLYTAKHALGLVIGEPDLPDGVAAVLELVQANLASREEFIDHCAMRRGGFVVQLRSWDNEEAN